MIFSEMLVLIVCDSYTGYVQQYLLITPSHGLLHIETTDIM